MTPMISNYRLSDPTVDPVIPVKPEAPPASPPEPLEDPDAPSEPPEFVPGQDPETKPVVCPDPDRGDDEFETCSLPALPDGLA